MMDGPSMGIKIPDIFTSKQKFWGFLGTLGVYTLLAGIGYKGLPFLTELFTRATSTFEAFTVLMIKGAIAAAVLFVLSQKQTWALGRTIFNAWARLAGKTIAKAMPVEVAESYLSGYVKPKLTSVAAGEASVRGQLESVVSEETANQKQIDEFKRLAVELESRTDSSGNWANREDQLMFDSITQKLNFCEQAGEELADQKQLLETFRDVIVELRAVLKSEYDTISFFTKQLIRQYETAKETARVARTVGGVIGGDAMREVYEMSVQFMQNRIHQSMGEVEVVMGMVKEVTGVRKLKGAAASRELLEKIRSAKQRTGQLADQVNRDKQVLTSKDPDQIRDLMKQSVVVASPVAAARARRLLGGV